MSEHLSPMESTLARSWEFVNNNEGENNNAEMKPEPLPLASPTPIVSDILTEKLLRETANYPSINIEANEAYKTLSFVHKTLSKEAFVGFLNNLVEDAIERNTESLELLFNLPFLTLNSPEEYKALVVIIINAVFTKLLDMMNPQNSKLCMSLVYKLAEYFHLVMRNTIYKDLFSLNASYLCTGIELGRGKFATVCEGRNMETGEKLAIKIMDKQKLLAEDPRVGDFLQRETSIMKSLNHPSVVRLYDVLDNGATLYLVMEFCPGGTLADYLTMKKQIPEEEAQIYIRQIASGLKYMKARNVSHRDLKPANLLLVTQKDGTRHAKITDFTFARFLNPGEISKTLVGSPLYMAPEIFNDYQYDGVADLWSVGVILFEMVVGHVPFPADTLMKLIQVLRTSEAVIPDSLGLSQNCKHLIRCLLQKDAKSRISWENFFAHPWIGLGATIERALTTQDYAANAQAMKLLLENNQKKMEELSAQNSVLQQQIVSLRAELTQKERDLTVANNEIAAFKVYFQGSVAPNH